MKRDSDFFFVAFFVTLVALFIAMPRGPVGTAHGELLPDEKLGVRNLVLKIESLGDQIVSVSGPGLKDLVNAREQLIRGFFLLVHAVVGRNPQERQNLCQSFEPLDFDNCLGPREEYVRRAWFALDASGIQMNVDRTLAYGDVFPSDHLTLPRMSIGPHGPYQTAQTHLWRAAGQYGEDGLEDLVDALSLNEPCLVEQLPDGRACNVVRDDLTRTVMRQLVLLQNAIVRGSARAARVGFSMSELEEEELRPRDFALRPIDNVQGTATQTNFHNSTLTLGRLAELPLGPLWSAKVSSATGHTGDAWRHAGIWAQRYMRIPGVN